MFKLIALIIETGAIVGIAFLISSILFKKDRTPLLPKRHSRTFTFVMWFLLVTLKLNSFYLDEGGMEYRRIPLRYPYEIRETESGTYLLKNGGETGLAAIDECDIAAFSLQKDKVIFQCTSSEEAKVFSFEHATLTKPQVTAAITWITFEKEYPIYHYLKRDSIIALVLTLLYICLMLYLHRHYSPVRQTLQ